MESRYYNWNENPLQKKVGDCQIRGVATALNQYWDKTLTDLYNVSLEVKNVPNSDEVLKKYMKDLGYTYITFKAIKGQKRMNVKRFAEEFQEGRYLLNCACHIVAVVDGYYYDTWNSGEKCVYGYWKTK